MSGATVVNASYSLAAQCGSEIIATALTIYLGESIIANELLSKTKGARMGWLAVALGFGLSFGVTIWMLGYISAHLNPATCLALWVIGKISFVDFLALSAAEFAGAFIGACLVFLHYLPHFKTVPEPMATSGDELLLRSRDALSPEALAIASYDTRQKDKKRNGGSGGDGVVGGVSQAIRDIKYYFAETHEAPLEHKELVEVALGRESVYGGAADAVNKLRRRSVQVCDVHRRLKDMSLEEFKEKLHLQTTAGGGLPRSASITLGELDHALTAADGASSAPLGVSASEGVIEMSAAQQGWERRASAFVAADEGGAPPKHSHHFLSTEGMEAVGNQLASTAKNFKEAYHRHVERFGEKQSALYDAAVVADQNAKLTIFATRPAIYTPVFNFICEAMCTCALVFGALMMYARRDMLSGEFRALFRSMEGMFIGFFVFVCILGLGGPTGIAANPARDFSPRLAHALLPIAGKGPSEWFYSWIPFIAPFFGGAMAGGFYLLVQMMNHSAI